MNNIGLEVVFWTALSVYLLAKLGVFKKKWNLLKITNNYLKDLIKDNESGPLISILPKLDNDFVKRVDPEAKDLNDYQMRFKDKLDQAYEEKANEAFNQHLCDALIEKVNPEFPKSMMESYLNQMVDDVMSRNQGQLEREKVIETYKPIAEQNLKWYLIRKAIIDSYSFLFAILPSGIRFEILFINFLGWSFIIPPIARALHLTFDLPQ